MLVQVTHTFLVEKFTINTQQDENDKTTEPDMPITVKGHMKYKT